MPEITFTTKYPAGHSYQHTWTSTDIFCPNCGTQHVWRDTSRGDYYVGEQHMCTACEASFYLPSMRVDRPLDMIDQQTMDHIRDAESEEASHG